MLDASGLVGQTFLRQWSDELLTVHAAFTDRGELRLVVSAAGGPLYTTNVESLRRPQPEPTQPQPEPTQPAAPGMMPYDKHFIDQEMMPYDRY